MSTKPASTFLDSDLLILNSLVSGSAITYKVTFKQLSDNVLYLLSGNGNNDNSLILLNDINEVNTDYFIATRDTHGNPTLVDTVGAVYDGETIGKDSRNWILQYTKTGVSGKGDYPGKKFVLSDPKTVFQDIIGGAIQLDDLNDVSTYLNRNPVKDTVGGFRENDILDTFLLLTEVGVIDPNTDKVTKFQTYQPYSLTKAVTDALDPNSPNGGIEIHLDNLVEVNPNFDTVNGDLKQLVGKLEITDEYTKGISSAKKYLWIDSVLTGDEQLTYIAIPKNEVRNYDTVGGSLGTSGTETAMGAGWYYADQYYGAPLAPAELADNELEVKDRNVPIGGVRILTYKDTKLVVDNTAGGMKVDTVGGTPTNIGITDKGVLYSTIPSTLSFIDSIFIGAGGGEDESFASGGLPVPIANGTAPGGVPGGPGFHTTPSVGTTNPSVGDFYVVKFVQDSTGTPADDIDNKFKQLAWRKGTPTSDNVGSTPTVRNGDMVAWGGDNWAVIGTVNTDTVAQDLQSVTTRGKTTNQGIEITGGGGTQNLVIENRNDTVYGIICGSDSVGTDGIISVGGLNFERFPILP